MSNEQGPHALLRAAREAIDRADKVIPTAPLPTSIYGHVRKAVEAFRALDHPDCPHGCIGGVTLRPLGVYDPCPIHGEKN